MCRLFASNLAHGVRLNLLARLLFARSCHPVLLAAGTREARMAGGTIFLLGDTASDGDSQPRTSATGMPPTCRGRRPWSSILLE
jgi:hypothetical protein